MAKIVVLCGLILGFGQGIVARAVSSEAGDTTTSIPFHSEEDFSRLLGLQHVPKATGFPIPRYMKGLYNHIEDEDENSQSATTIKAVIQTFDKGSRHGNKFVQFDVTAVSEKVVDSAALVLRRLKRSSQWTDTRAYEVGIHEVLDESGHLPVSLLDMKTVTRTTEHDDETSLYHVFNVTAAARKWLRDPAANHGLGIEVKSVAGKVIGHQQVRKLYHMHRHSEFAPLLVLYSSQSHTALPAPSFRRRRRRRSVPAPVSSKKLSVININYCDGTCRAGSRVPEGINNHAYLRSMFQAQVPTLPSPSCVPDKLRGISILYYSDDRTLTYKLMKDVIAVSCACA